MPGFRNPPLLSTPSVMSLIRLLRVLAVLLVLATGLVLAQLTGTAAHDLQRTREGLTAIERLRLALVVAEMASRERGPTNGMLGDDTPHRPALTAGLAEARARTDKAFAAYEQAAAAADAGRGTMAAARADLVSARRDVDRLLATPLARRSPDQISAAVYAMVAVIPRLAPTVSGIVTEAQTLYPPAGDDVQGARLIAELREYAGLLGSHFTAALASGERLTPFELGEAQRTRGRIDELRFLVAVRIRGGDDAPAVVQAWDEAQQRYFVHSLKLAEQVVAASMAGQRYGQDPADFAAAYVPDMNSLLAVRDALLVQARDTALGAEHEAERTLAGVVGGGVVLLVVLLGSIALVQRRLLGPLAVVAGAINALARNKLNIRLPRVVADDEMAAVVGAVESLRERTGQRLALEGERDALIEQLREQSNTDALTGLPNRRGFIAAAEHLLAQARRHDFGVVAILLDIDHFKRFNDELGHAAGDAALVAVAEAIRAELRDSDLVGRLGGEEFVVLLSHSDPHSAEAFAERLRKSIERIAPQSGKTADATPVHTTASLGVAAFGPDCPTLELLLSRADAAMYRAKTAGRNRVMMAAA